MQATSAAGGRRMQCCRDLCEGVWVSSLERSADTKMQVVVVSTTSGPLSPVAMEEKVESIGYRAPEINRDRTDGILILAGGPA